MKYQQLPKELYIRNRQKFVKHLKPNSMAVFTSNDIMPTNADGTMPFRQNNDLFYLSGVDQEETMLVIFPDAHHEHQREILFVRETSPEIAIWEGEKLTKEEATEVTGIKNIQWTDSFDKAFQSLMGEAQNVYLNSNEHTRAVLEVETREMRFSKWCRSTFPHHNYERSAPIMHKLRSVKEPEEIEQMQNACNITGKAIDRVLKFIKPGVMEYEIEAEVSHEFQINGSRGFAYTPIVAGGKNACALHYIENDKPVRDGDLILMDVGCEYGNYASDLTRSIPVNGRYSDRQKQVYNAVRKVMKDSIDILRPGTTLYEYHKEVGRMMTSALVDLKLLDKKDVENQDPANPAYKKYFMHGTSHHIGLDVHDVGHWSDPIQPGNVFTVEPGIYIREEGLGIRIENDLVVLEDGHRDLMGHIPIEVEEIEDVMNS